MAKNIIKLNRGDSYEFPIDVIIDEDNPDNKFLTSTDAVYFALLYPHQRFEDAILIKGFDHTDYIIKDSKNTGKILIKIEPRDTKNLAPGIYYYTIKLKRGGTMGVVDDYDDVKEIRTLVERTKFIIND